MEAKVALILGELESNKDTIVADVLKVLEDYKVPYLIKIVNGNISLKDLKQYAQESYDNGVRVLIAGKRGAPSFSNEVAKHFNIPTIGLPMRSLNDENDIKEVFSVLQQTNEEAVANIALDGGTNAGLLAIQILGSHDATLQQRILEFKENLKNKIVAANKEVTKIQYPNKVN